MQSSLLFQKAFCAQLLQFEVWSGKAVWWSKNNTDYCMQEMWCSCWRVWESMTCCTLISWTNPLKRPSCKLSPSYLHWELLNDLGELTKLGRRMAEFPLDPMQSKMVLASETIWGRYLLIVKCTRAHIMHSKRPSTCWNCIQKIAVNELIRM